MTFNTFYRLQSTEFSQLVTRLEWFSSCAPQNETAPSVSMLSVDVTVSIPLAGNGCFLNLMLNSLRLFKLDDCSCIILFLCKICYMMKQDLSF